jgi:oligogalacturonide lyase
MHHRTMRYEIAGHEFFGHDGQWVWYDLQTPRSDKFWLAGVNVENGKRLRYPLQRNEWSVHYNVSWDGKLFAGDGGGPDSVANRTPLPDKRPLNPPGNGQWIYLFRPQNPTAKEIATEKNARPHPGPLPQERGKTADNFDEGKFEVEKLVDLSRHNYRLEPNLRFTPDGKWIVFRSNMHDATHVYAVEVAKAKGK